MYTIVFATYFHVVGVVHGIPTLAECEKEGKGVAVHVCIEYDRGTSSTEIEAMDDALAHVRRRIKN